jgi:hypothetical protein
MVEGRNPPSRNPNVCTLCTSRLDGSDFSEPWEAPVMPGERRDEFPNLATYELIGTGSV